MLVGPGLYGAYPFAGAEGVSAVSSVGVSATTSGTGLRGVLAAANAVAAAVVSALGGRFTAGSGSGAANCSAVGAAVRDIVAAGAAQSVATATALVRVNDYTPAPPARVLTVSERSRVLFVPGRGNSSLNI